MIKTLAPGVVSSERNDMGKFICTEQPSDLSAILPLLHGAWFDVDDIRFTPESEALIIRLRRGEERRSLWFMWGNSARGKGDEILLTISHALGYEVNDTEKVGIYDLDNLIFCASESVVEIRAGIPLVIRVRVSSFRLCVEETGRVIEH